LIECETVRTVGVSPTRRVVFVGLPIMAPFEAVRGRTVRFVSVPALFTSIRRRAYTSVVFIGTRTAGGDEIFFTVRISEAASAIEAEEPGCTVAKTHGSSSSPTIVPTASSLYISILLSRSPRRASHSSRRSINSCSESVVPAVRMNRCFKSSLAFELAEVKRQTYRLVYLEDSLRDTWRQSL
jgi:hypothetical protein